MTPLKVNINGPSILNSTNVRKTKASQLSTHVATETGSPGLNLTDGAILANDKAKRNVAFKHLTKDEEP